MRSSASAGASSPASHGASLFTRFFQNYYLPRNSATTATPFLELILSASSRAPPHSHMLEEPCVGGPHWQGLETDIPNFCKKIGHRPG